ncbi:hypothetical protein HK101_000476 [Irineochytrium annulatum]|nr:hypothetical protein HK101_000476 [Irineochytrium annulatum]
MSSGHATEKKSVENPYYVNHLNNELKLLTSTHSHLDVRLKACGELAHVLYHGGVLDSYIVENPKVLDLLITIVRERKEPLSLRLQAIQTFSIVCRASETIQRLICERGAVDLLIGQLQDGYDEMRKWAAHCLMFLMIKNYKKYLSHLKSHAVQTAIKHVATDDWTKWKYNDADVLLSFILSQ